MQITSWKPELAHKIPQVLGEIYARGLKRCDRGLDLLLMREEGICCFKHTQDVGDLFY